MCPCLLKHSFSDLIILILNLSDGVKGKNISLRLRNLVSHPGQIKIPYYFLKITLNVSVVLYIKEITFVIYEY